MSVIWGNISWKQKITLAEAAAMQHPFQEKCKIDRYESVHLDHVFMGCGIQYLTKEAVTEVLPFSSDSPHFLLTADCLLDNRRELLTALGLPPETPDGVLISSSYSRWGISCLRHLRGLFSLAVYDYTEHALYLAVDQLAARCLYYYRNGSQVTFATLCSSIRALHPEVTSNPLFIKDFLTAPGLAPNISPTDTPYKGIYKLNPGTYLRITEQGLSEHTYWSPSSSDYTDYKNAAGYGQAFRDLFSTCVQDALRCNGEVAVALSSGLDSSSVGVLAALHLQQENRSLSAYTYVPYETPNGDRNLDHVLDETRDVLRITDRYPNMKPHFLNNHGHNCLENLRKEINILEIPFKAYANMPNLMEIYESAASDGCKVLLTGQAGNSTVSYGYIDDILCSIYQQKHCFTFLSWLNRYCKHVKEPRRSALLGCIRYYNASLKKHSPKTDCTSPNSKLDNPFLSKDILTDYPLSQRHAEYAPNTTPGYPMSQEDYHSWVWFAPFLTYIGELETKMGLYYGIIIRDPTKDMRMIQFCYHLPYELFAWQGTPRWLIRGNLRDLLPEELMNNWMRYGVQNSDCFLRIQRDWNQLFPVINEAFASLACPYFDMVSIRDFLQKHPQHLTDAEEQDFMYLCFLYILLLHQNFYHLC